MTGNPDGLRRRAHAAAEALHLTPLIARFLQRNKAPALAAEHERLARQALRAYNASMNALRSLSIHDYGSLTPGFPGWAERWEQDRKRVLFFAPQDYAGSFVQWARAVNASTEWAARVIVVTFHPYGYENDLTFGVPENLGGRAHELIEQADVIHLKDEDGFFTRRNRLEADTLVRHGKPTVFTAYGSVSRERQDQPEYRSYVQGFDAVVSVTPDLCFPWLREPTFVGHAVDTEAFDVTWADAWSVGHSPSDREVKGTDAFLSASRRLSSDLGVTVDLIAGVSHLEALRRKETLGLFFDQAGRNRGSGPLIGWYGNSALEAAVRGIPTIAHLSERAFDQAANAGLDIRDRCGILSTGPDSSEIHSTMSGYFTSSPEERAGLSQRTRAWVEEFHGFNVVGSRLARVYDALT